MDHDTMQYLVSSSTWSAAGFLAGSLAATIRRRPEEHHDEGRDRDAR